MLPEATRCSGRQSTAGFLEETAMRKIAVVATMVLGSFVGVSQAKADHFHHGHGHHGYYRPHPVYRAYYPAPAPYCAPPVVYRPAPVYPYPAYPTTTFGVSTPRFSFFYGN